MRHTIVLLLILEVAGTSATCAQERVSRLVTQAIDETQSAKLSGNVHPLATKQNDQGAVPDAFPADRVLLLLNRSPEKETELREFLLQIHQPGSAGFHRWLTPEEFGERFGPADSDVAAVANWLRAQGFRVAQVTKGKQFIEFSGTAGQLRDAFHTEIHRYKVDGESHYANAMELSIPAALGPLVRGFSPLHDFHAKPYSHVAAQALYSRANHRALPLWTIANPFGTANPFAFPFAPEDLATQYDLKPLYQAGIDGTGQTIGIINASNIDISLVDAYRQLFGLGSNPTEVVIDGQDPGTLRGVDVEAYLDVEVSGAVAPKATVNLYISDGGNLQDPVALAAIRAVEDNQASVLSVSFGQCEPFLGNAGNQFWADLWEQAAAQGQTVLVASGDTGPLCSLFYATPSVSGLASTPWNVAVGGTDFFYADFAAGGASANTLWSETNDSSQGSLKAPLPEQVWDDPFGLDVIADGLARHEIFAGGGGASNCVKITTTASSSVCGGGYTKPSWQSGTGVPADSVRDLPDVSLFASNGANLSAYPICAFAGECVLDGAGQAEVVLTGGTSASTPAMAGIMALVNQKYGRQGQANFTLYALAQQKPAAFHDITLGGNNVPCQTGAAECAQNADGHNETTLFSAAPGYDLASGLGSVDASVLVNSWNTVTFQPTTTSLQLSATSITHGTPVTVTTSVKAGSGTATPTGDVAILTDAPLPSNASQTMLPLNAGSASSAINYLPGGYYNVTARYGGDSLFGASTSAPVALRVTPENSTITLALNTGNTKVARGGSVPYDAPLPLTLSIQPVGVSSLSGKPNGVATGTATFTIDSISSALPLNASGEAIWTAPALTVGTHTAGASYSGDASYNASSAAPVTFTVGKGIPFMRDSVVASRSTTGPGVDVPVGGSLTVTIVVGPNNGQLFGNHAPVGTAAPTGTVTACLEGPSAEVCFKPSYSQTATLSSPAGINSLSSTASFTFTNLASGFYYPSYSYSGDANWQSWGLLDLLGINVAPITPLTASNTALSITPASISTGQFATISTTVTGSGTSGIAPGGEVDYFNNGVFLTYILLSQNKPGTTNSATFRLGTSAFFSNGTNQITAIYRGDSSYQTSTSNVANISVTQTVGDFLLVPQVPEITFGRGSSGKVGLNLTSLNNFNGAVSLSCATSSGAISCGVNPSAPTLTTSATATLTVSPAAATAAIHTEPSNHIRSLEISSVLFACALAGAYASRKRQSLIPMVSFSLLAVVFLTAGCGGGSQNIQPPPPPPPPAVGITYSVVVSATANGIVHNAKITVIVR